MFFFFQSGNERSGRSSRLGSVSSETPSTPSRTKSTSSENGDLDYKKLWEESQADNERLKDKLRRSDEQLKETKSLLEKGQSNQNKSTLSEAEKRERRAMERKFSEMEEELQVIFINHLFIYVIIYWDFSDSRNNFCLTNVSLYLDTIFFFIIIKNVFNQKYVVHYS